MIQYRPFIILVLISLLLLAISRTNWLPPLADFVRSPIRPVLASETTIGRQSVNFLTIIGSLRGLAKENAELRAKLTELEAKLIEYKEVRHENDILRQELKFIENTTGNYLPAQLIGRTATGVIKDIIVNRGGQDGVSAGDLVIAQGYMVGIVAEVSDKQSIVRLINHPRSIVPVLLQDSRSTGLLRGGIGGLVMSDILVDATVKVDEPILSSGLGGNLPAGIPVGKVVAVTGEKGDITKSASVVSPVDIAKLEMVFIQQNP